MPLSLFCPWLFLFCPWLSLSCPWFSLSCPWLSLFCPWLHLFCPPVNVFVGQDDSVAALCSLSLALFDVGAKLQIPGIKGGLVLINMATMTKQMLCLSSKMKKKIHKDLRVLMEIIIIINMKKNQWWRLSTVPSKVWGRGFFRCAGSFPYISRQGMTSLDLCLQLIPSGQGNRPRRRQPALAGLASPRTHGREAG